MASSIRQKIQSFPLYKSIMALEYVKINRQLILKFVLFHFCKASEQAAAINHAGSANVVDLGWFLFGGYNGSLVNAQQLKDPDAQWSAGPLLYKNYSDKEQCLVQVTFGQL